MMKIKIIQVCATERQTYFGGEELLSPGEIPEALAKEWLSAGFAELLVADADAEPAKTSIREKRKTARA